MAYMEIFSIIFSLFNKGFSVYLDKSRQYFSSTGQSDYIDRYSLPEYYIKFSKELMVLMMRGLLGITVLIVFSWIISENRRLFRFRNLITGIFLQFAIALIFFKVPVFQSIFLYLNKLVDMLDKASVEGTSMVFGYLGGGELPFAETYPGASFVFAFRSLPIVIVVSALSALFLYWKITPFIIKSLSRFLEKTMGIGAAVGISTAANIFVGMIEAPLLIKPYVNKMTRSELFLLMTAGMATIAGTVLMLYAAILEKTVPNSLGNILTASIISAPAAILVSRIMVPETQPSTEGRIDESVQYNGSMDAVSRGTLDGMKLFLNIVGMLIVLVALVSLVNQILLLLPFEKPITLQLIMGYIFTPLMWLIGIPWEEAHQAGSLMGIKTILNELLAYMELASLPAGSLSEKSRLVITYAMCGFANFGSLGIMIGGLYSIAPERSKEISSLAPKSLISGTIATLMTGAVVAVIL